MQENYNDLVWEIDDLPIGSSTPDEFFEMSYRATTNCQHCGSRIDGTANYWSRYSDMSMSWLNDIYYEQCECQNEADDEYDQEFLDELLNNEKQ